MITDLGTLRGMEESEAVAINERGRVVGNSYRNVDSLDRPHAFVWEGRNLVRLGTLGGSLSSASAINADGWIVGWGATISGARHAFLWRDGRMLDLGTLPGSTNSAAVAINERGQVVGIGYTGLDKFGQPSDPHAFLWQNGRMRRLGALRGGRASKPVAINKRGQIVGWSETGGSKHACLWQGARITDLGALPNLPDSTAVAINERGQVVGTSHWSSGGNITLSRPFLWQNGRIRSLDTSKLGGDESYASAIDNRGRILGAGQDRHTDAFHALLWQNGTMTDLGRLEHTNGNSFATAINSSGLIIGSSDTAGGRHAVVWQNLQITDLGALGGSDSSAAAVNDDGQIAGTSATGTGTYTDYPKHAVIWTLRPAG